MIPLSGKGLPFWGGCIASLSPGGHVIYLLEEEIDKGGHQDLSRHNRTSCGS